MFAKRSSVINSIYSGQQQFSYTGLSIKIVSFQSSVTSTLAWTNTQCAKCRYSECRGAVTFVLLGKMGLQFTPSRCQLRQDSNSQPQAGEPSVLPLRLPPLAALAAKLSR